MNIYVVSSWRNKYQPEVVEALRKSGHTVYDFKHDGFHWSAIDQNWEKWNYDQFILALDEKQAAMKEADACVLVLPCGRSAHLEAGYFVGANKKLIIYCPEYDTPDLMYKITIYNFDKLSDVLKYLQ